MKTELYLAYRMVMYLITTFFAVKLSCKCIHTIPRIVVVGIGIILLLMNEDISAFMFPVFGVVLGILVIVFVFMLLFLFIVGHTIGSAFQHFKMFKPKQK